MNVPAVETVVGTVELVKVFRKPQWRVDHTTPLPDGRVRTVTVATVTKDVWDQWAVEPAHHGTAEGWTAVEGAATRAKAVQAAAPTKA